jgi:hypothetical protein
MNAFIDSDFFPFVLIAGIIAVIAAGCYLAWLYEQKRRDAFRALAQKLGLKYRDRDGTMDEQYGFLNRLCAGKQRYAFNILEGEYKGHSVLLFDYHYVTESRDSKGNRQTQTHYISFFILNHWFAFPELRIYPEGIFSKLGQMIGFDDIDFESIAFSNKYVVKSEDKKFAYDICHARMMEYLLRHDVSVLEIQAQCLATWEETRLDVEAIPGKLDQIVAIRELFPAYLCKT